MGEGLEERLLAGKQKESLDTLLGLGTPDAVPALNAFVSDLFKGLGAAVHFVRVRGPFMAFFGTYDTERSRLVELSFHATSEGKDAKGDVEAEFSRKLPYPDAAGVFFVNGALRYARLLARTYPGMRGARRYFRIGDELREQLVLAVAERQELREKHDVSGPFRCWEVQTIIENALERTFALGPRLLQLPSDGNPVTRYSCLSELELVQDRTESFPGLTKVEIRECLVDPVYTSEDARRIGRLWHACPDANLEDGNLKREGDLSRISWQAFSPAVSTIPFVETAERPIRVFYGGKLVTQAVKLAHEEAPLVVTNSPFCDSLRGFGRNLQTVFLPWPSGHTYEDGIVVSRSAAEGLLVTAEERTVVCEISSEQEVDRSVSKDGYERGIIRQGPQVSAGQPLVYLLEEAPEPDADATRRRPSLLRGRVRKYITSDFTGEVLKVEESDALPAHRRERCKVRQVIRITLKVALPIRVGDKLANRHGNKGVVTAIVDDDKMPTVQVVGKPERVDIVASLKGVEQRENYGQLIEAIAGLHARMTGTPVVTAAFADDIRERWREWARNSGLDASTGLATVHLPGREQPVQAHAGLNFWFRPDHHADEKLAARRGGKGWAYGIRSGQPVRGRARGGGQRLGLMEIDCLLAHRAHGLREEFMLHRSDENLRKKLSDGERVMTGDFQALRNIQSLLHALHVKLVAVDKTGTARDMLSVAPADLKEVRFDRLSDEEARQGIELEQLIKEHDRHAKDGEDWHSPLDCPDCCDGKQVYVDLRKEYEYPLPLPWKLRYLPVVPNHLRPPEPERGISHDLTKLYTFPKYWAFDAGQPGLRELLNPTPKMQERKDLDERIRKVLVAIRYQVVSMLGVKNGILYQNVLGRRLDHSGRAVIVPDASLGLDECVLPATIYDQVCTGKPDVAQSEYVLLNRQPSLHRLNMLAFRPRRDPEALAVRIHPLVVQVFGGDFDGDTMAVLGVTSATADAERLLPSRNMLHPAHGNLAFAFQKEMRDGLDWLMREEPESLRELLGRHDIQNPVLPRTVAECEGLVVAEWKGGRHERAASLLRYLANAGFAAAINVLPGSLLIRAEQPRGKKDEKRGGRKLWTSKDATPTERRGTCVERLVRSIDHYRREKDAVPQIGGLSKELSMRAGAVYVTMSSCNLPQEKRSILDCEADAGACAACYGTDPSTGALVEVGAPIGTIAVQAIMERALELCLKAAKKGADGIDPFVLRTLARRARKGDRYFGKMLLKEFRSFFERSLKLLGGVGQMPVEQHFAVLVKACCEWERGPHDPNRGLARSPLTELALEASRREWPDLEAFFEYIQSFTKHRLEDALETPHARLFFCLPPANHFLRPQ